ncbi:class I adenylate-forming enzyme family protein [Amycolatopsis echigonensis]|uniref:Acyl--CoA ligase n=1 Tax=Amycolatopsis echigonensis TaxID=2576905 RepID=A0A8E1W5H2_9PSEU|nr:class I adenylate-forming enzyme family protein [Amycolatopsis echigonensis]MBB2504416.1 acyl--CoA ligase [Amycolatopsis echigonensis]
MPAPLRTVAQLITSGAIRHPGRVAVIDPDGRRLSYRQLADDATQLGNALRANGLQAGDRVAVWLEDGADHVVLYAACALAGLVVAPVNVRHTAAEAEHVLTDSGAKALVFGPAVQEKVAEIPGIDDLLLLPTAEVRAYRAFLEAGSTKPLPEPDSADLFILGYTSGTTGRPKGARLTQGSVLNLARINALSYRLPLGSVAAMTGSMSFVAVVPAHVLTHFYVGGTVVFPGRWDVGSLTALVAEHRATFTYAPSPLLGEFTEAIRSHPSEWASLTTLLHSASKASPEALRQLGDAAGTRLIEGWGMTENSGGLMTVTSPADVAVLGDALFTTVGRPVAETQVLVADADGEPAPCDGTTVGELWVHSPCLADGYWQQPEATHAAFRKDWFRTGDLGTIDPHGYVRIADRRTDLIVSGGMNVYPSEVERVILTAPGVAACAVVGLPHPRWGQTVAAAVVPAAGAVLTAEDVISHCLRFLAGYKKPTVVRFVESLPMTHSQKVARHQVRRLLGG